MVRANAAAAARDIGTKLACAAALMGIAITAAFAGTFDVANTNDSGGGSLRDAITQANAAGGPHTITFSTTGTISPLSALPALTQQTTIGPAAAGTVTLNGASAGSGVDGLTLSADGCVVRNLVINGFGGSGIRVTSNGNTITGNRIGTNTAGTAAVSNGNNGISLENSSGNQIGQPGFGNVLSGNAGAGIALTNSSNNILEADVIGLDVTATTALSNVYNGVLLQGNSNDNQVGVVGSVADTYIAGNGGAGVAILAGLRNRIRARIYTNTGGGIDLDRNGAWPWDGVNFNDSNDADSGANGLLNAPVLLQSSTTGLNGRLRGAPNVQQTIDVYSSTSCDNLGFGEGGVYLGSTTATTDANGTTTFAAGPWAPVAGTSAYTATATDASGNTSEFSQCMTPGRRPVETLGMLVAVPDIPFQPPKAALLSTIGNLNSALNPLAATPFNPGMPLQGQSASLVVGDWDGDGIETMGAYATGGAVFYTNDTGPTSNWIGVWFGFENKPAVAGRFDGAVDHDCIGVVDSVDNYLGSGDTVFAMYWTCNLTDGGTSPKNGLWIGAPIPNSGFPELAANPPRPHQFVAGDFTGSGVDTIAIRRGPYFVWGSLAQYFADYHQGQAVAGDWDGDGIATFGLVLASSGPFLYKNDLQWHTAAIVGQSITPAPLGSGETYRYDSWRPGGS
jgi:hypothetical protein